MKKQLPTTSAQASSAFFSAVFYSSDPESLMKRLFQPLLRNLFVLILIIGFAESVKADFAVTTNGGSGLMATYPSLAAAITDLNLATITSPVIITCPTGAETAPAGGYSITAQGTAVNTIVITGNGAANSIITAGVGVSTTNDAIFKLVGADFVTIQGFSMLESGGNVTTTTQVEWGVALLHASVTNGAQNNTIQNNTITLNKTNLNTFGIYANNRHSAALPTTTEDITNNTTGPNSGNKIYGNTISNVNMGIAFIGCSTAANQDIGNDVGGAAAGTGNTLTNWGGAAATTAYVSNSGTSYCIFMNHQVGDNVSFNTLTSATISGTSVTLRGIYKDYTTTGATIVGTTTITNNTVTITDNFTSGTLECIRTQGTVATTSTFNINSNTILNTSVGGASSSTTIVGIVNSSGPGVLSMNNNIIRGTTSTATTGGFTGISNTGGIATTLTINNNQIGNALGGAITFSAATSGAVAGIVSSGTLGASATASIQTNDFRGITHSVAGTSSHIYINLTGATATGNVATIANNTFTNLNVNTSGTTTFISQSYTASATGTKNTNSNSIVTAYVRGGASGTVTLILDNGSTVTGAISNCQSNNFSNITLSGTSTLTGISYTDGGTAPTRTVTGNTLNNWSVGTGTVNAMNFTYWNGVSSLSTNTITNITGQGAITGITIGSSVSTATSVNVASNTITNLTSTGAGGAVNGITCSNTSTLININNNTIRTLSSTGASAVNGIAITAATTTNVFKNTICDLLGTNASSTVNGILVSAGTTVNVSNNRIGDLRATAANAANPLNGINITGGTTVNAYYNTVNLNAVSSGALFGSSAISVSTTPTVTLDNNIFVNTSGIMGAGLAVAYRRSTTTLTTYGAASDRNDFFASTIFTDGTGPNTFSALGPYKTFVGPTRDANSVTENPPFLSTTCGNTNFLKVNTTIPTIVESNGANVGGITDDFENDIRFGNPGYVGTGTKPDIGADEFNGLPAIQCMGAPAAGSITGVTAVCTGLGTTLSLTGASTDLGVTYQWKSGTTMGGPYLTLLGTSTTQATGPLTMATYYVVDVTCTNPGGSTSTTSEKSVLVNPLPPVMVSPLTGSYCTPSGSAVTLTASGASTYSWSPTLGLTPTTGAVVSATPPSTTNYVVTGTDGNGCINTATSTISVAVTPQNLVALATPPSICTGTSSNLTSSGYAPTSTTVNNYTFATSTGATLDPMVGATTVVSSNTDDAPMNTSNGGNTTPGPSVALPFTFNYHGANYTFFSASPDGWIALSTSNAAATASFTNTTTLTTNVPKIYPYWDDCATGTTGSVQTLVTGVAPNRIFKVQWFVTIPRATSGPANSTFQAWLYETTNIVELRYGTMGVPTTGTSSGGLSGGALFNSLTFATNTASNSSANDTQIGTPASGRMYTFAAPSAALTYSWSPAGSVVSPGSQNTATNALSMTTVFTVSVTNAGCSSTASATVTVDPLNCSPATVSAAHCANTNFTVTATKSGGGAPFTYAWTKDGNPIGGNTQTLTDNTTPGTYLYACLITDACGGSCTSSLSVTVNGLPTISIAPTPATARICGTGSVSLAASGGASYSWSPTTALTPTTGSPVTATPAITTIYTVTGTDANGCVGTASQTVTVGPAVTLSSVTATPAIICSGSTSVLNAIATTSPALNYTVASIPVSAETPSGTPTVLATGGVATPTPGGNSLDDGYWDLIPLPFSFTYFGVSYSTVRIGTNGNVQFGAAVTGGNPGSSSWTSQTIPTAGGNLDNFIGGPWIDQDLSTSPFGTLRYFVNGVSPNRKFVISYEAVHVFSSADNNTSQIILNENGTIDVLLLGGGLTSTATKAIGIENAGGTLGVAAPGRNSGTWTTLADEAWRFSPQALNYSWTPSTGLTPSATVASPTTPALTNTTVYNVTVTEPVSGCNATGTTTVTVIPIPSPPLITATNSTCQSCTLSGGTFNIITSCGAGTTLTYYSDAMGSNPTTVAPIYNQTTPMTIYYACVDNIAGCRSAIQSLTTVPGTCTSPSATITSSTSIYQGSTGNMASVPNAGAGATYTWSLSSGMITGGAGTRTITYKAGTPPSMTINVTVTIPNGCSSSSSNVVTVLIPGPSTMTWEPDNITPTSCGPSTNCCLDTLCFNLKYTPGVTGFLTTYTTGFFINCLGATSPIGYNKSCVMTDNSFQISQCALIDSVLFNSSGNNGAMTVPITQGSPLIVHRVCINISTGESVQIREDNITNLSASIDQIGSGHLTEFPAYTTQTFSKPAPVVPANVTVTISCPADTLFPITPAVVDFCGNPVPATLTSRVSTPSSLSCEGTKVYNFNYTDCSGYTQTWKFTYIVEYLDFSISAAPGGSIVTCPALSNVVPTPPVVMDHCGHILTPSISDSGLPACEGLRTYVFTYIDCEGNNHIWTYAYFVEYEPIPNPVDVTQTVNCPLLANVVPVPPPVVDNCGILLSPSGPTSTPALTAMTCEGTRSFTWTYIDCEGNTQDFVYTYIVERQPFADPVDAGVTVACPVQTNIVPVPPAVLDNCGALLSPSGPVVSPIPACEGTRTYTWSYTDCEGNTGDYVFTYTVDRPPFTVPANAGSIVNCPEASNVVPVAPTVVDACGVTLIPIDTIKTAPVTCQGVDVTRTYTFHFKDCSGLTIPWVYTYTVRCFPLTLKVFLEGPYDVAGDTMKATLNTNHVLPGQDKLLSPSLSVQLNAPFTPFGQPYNMAPWNYNGNTGLQYGDPSAPGAPMGVIPYPPDVVDWVLVTVRKNGILPANNFWTCAGWVHTNGVVTFPDPCPGLVFNPGDSCYVLVQHRTHMGALSTHAATSACTNYIINWDFTTTNSYAPIFRYGEKLVEPGKWAMHGANGDQITSIAAIGSADLTTWRIFQNAYGYSIGDYNMSAFTESAGDESLWKANQNRTSGIIFY